MFIALSSLKETKYFLLLAHDLGYFSTDTYSALTDNINSSFGTLQALIKSVKSEVDIVGRVTASMLSYLLIAVGYHLATLC